MPRFSSHHLAPPRSLNNTIYTLYRWIQEMDQKEKSFFIIYDRTLLNSSIYRRDWTSKRQINFSSSMNTLVIYRLNDLSEIKRNINYRSTRVINWPVFRSVRAAISHTTLGDTLSNSTNSLIGYLTSGGAIDSRSHRGHVATMTDRCSIRWRIILFVSRRLPAKYFWISGLPTNEQFVLLLQINSKRCSSIKLELFSTLIACPFNG